MPAPRFPARHVRLLFLFTFFALWGFISLAMFVRRRGEQPWAAAPAEERHYHRAAAPRFRGAVGKVVTASLDAASRWFERVAGTNSVFFAPHYFESRHPELKFTGDLEVEGRALQQRVADVREALGPRGLAELAGRPLLEAKEYRRLPENVAWQREEARTAYPGADAQHLHGTLDWREWPDVAGFDWLDTLVAPLSRAIPDIRPAGCADNAELYGQRLEDLAPVSVIIIFCNEWPELLLRSVHSVLDKSPPALLKEILLVDDFSDVPEILPKALGGRGELEAYVEHLPKTRYIRLQERQGIVGARLRGIHEASGDSFVILDSHVETVEGWLEPLAAKMTAEPRVMVMPVIYEIDPKTYAARKGGIGCSLGMIWKVIEHSLVPSQKNPKRLAVKPYEWQTSPTHAGGLFGANVEFFLDVGGYDTGMSHWGTENVELSLRLWQCGGQMQCTECSHVHHLFGGRKRWRAPSGTTTNNKVRTISVWMDRYADLAFTVLGRPAHKIKSPTERLQLRQDLQCHDFQWFLDNVWPESDIRNLLEDVPRLGKLTNGRTAQCLTHSLRLEDCQRTGAAWLYFARPRFVHPSTDDEKCITHRDGLLSVDWCDENHGRGQRIDLVPSLDNDNEDSFQLRLDGQCLSASKADSPVVVFESCETAADSGKYSAQLWTWPKYDPPETFVPPTV